MSFRNAFTHGMLAIHDRRVRLSFFEGGPQERDLTDEFLTEMEEKLRTAYQGILTLSAKVGAPTAPQARTNP
jgi:fructoselysine-6-P-deglycase FrlB-like protein